jgi:hypothetical protein
MLERNERHLFTYQSELNSCVYIKLRNQFHLHQFNSKYLFIKILQIDMVQEMFQIFINEHTPPKLKKEQQIAHIDKHVYYRYKYLLQALLILF